MSPLKVGVARNAKLKVAKKIPVGWGWRLTAPGKKKARRAILISKFKSGKSQIGIFRILPGTR